MFIKKVKCLKVFHVIHGFPPEYMAGSEVYTYNLCKESAKQHEITVFYRFANPFLEEYEIIETVFHGLSIYQINLPIVAHCFQKRYQNPSVENAFKIILEKINPDIVHVSHLNYLSSTLLKIIKKRGIPIVFTLHDFWLMCPRGQLIHTDHSICEEINVEKCATCVENYFPTKEDARLGIIAREKYMKNIVENVDVFIAPSNFLRERFIDWGIPASKIVYSDYGFNTNYFNDFKKVPSNKIRFGFTGRIIPVKGVQLLIQAFNRLDGENAILKIFGKETVGTQYLKKNVKKSNIEFVGPYNNWEIKKVLSDIDVLVVPSIWYENSPLVIHEAFLAKIPVITSNLGGMKELVTDGKNGFLFKVGDVEDLLLKIKEFIKNPSLIEKFGKAVPAVKSIEDDASFISSIYEKLVEKGE